MLHTQESAETLAIQCLGWLLANDELRPVFMGATGVGEDDLRHGAADPLLLAGVLDFVMMDDAWVIAFCAAAQLPNDALIGARALLPGGQEEHWT